MPPLRDADFPFPLPLPLLLPLLLPWFEALPLLPALAALRLNPSQTAMAIEYVSSPVEQPALQMRRGVGPSTDLRTQSWGTTCCARALSAPGWRKKPVFTLTSPSSRDGRLEGSG